MGFVVSMEELQQEVLRIPAFQVKGQFSPERFQQLLSNNGMSPEQFLSNLQGSLLIDQLSYGIRNSALVTSQELARVYGMLYQQRSFGYFILPSAHFIAVTQPTDEQINSYYQQHADQFRTPEQVKVAYLLLTPQSLQAEIKVNPADIQQFYQDHASEFGSKPLEQVKANIEQRLSQQQLNQLLAAKSEQLENSAYTNPSSLEDAAKAVGLPIQTSEFMSRQGLKNNPVFADPKVLAVVFSDEVLKQNNNSELIELKDGSFLVVRIAEHQPSQNQPLAAVHDQIKQLLQKDQGQKQAGLQAYQIQQALENGEPVESLAKRYHLQWVNKVNVTRQDKSLPEQLASAIFNLPPSADPAKKVSTSVILSNGDYAIIQLESFHNADFSQASADDQAKLRADLANRWGELEYELFAKSAQDQAKVKKL